MKREKRKRKNLFLSITMLFAMFTFIVSPLGVYAASGAGTLSGLDIEAGTTCKSGTEYSIYYLFLDAQDKNHHDGANTSRPDGTRTSKDFQLGKKSGEIIKAGGIIPVVRNGATDATSKENWDLNTFFTVFHAAANKDTDNFIHAVDGKDFYVMSHKWYGDDDNEVNTKAAIGSLTPTQLAASSVQSTDIKTEVSFAINLTLGKGTIVRHYDEDWANLTVNAGLTEATVPSPNNTSGEWHPYFHPTVVYVTLCEPDRDQTGQVQLHYNANGGELGKVPEDSEKKAKGSDFTVDSNIPTRDGYVFMGWGDSNDATSGKYNGGDVIKNLTEDKTIYAIWEKADYGVNYDPNGGAGAPLPQAASKGECITISDVKPTKAGAKFLGWSLDPKATAPDSTYNAGKEYCGQKGTITLFAVWSTAAASANPKTGVVDYAIAFGSIAAIAGAGLIVSKRKKLFKQI